MIRQDFRLGPLAPQMADASARFQSNQAIAKLWAREAAFWKPEPEHTRIIANALGWLTVTELVRPHLDELIALAGTVRAEGFRHCVLLGMGGSSLCTEVVRRSDLPDPSYPAMIVLDSTVPAAIQQVQESIDPAHTLFIVASKSGGTAETAAFYAFFFDRVRRLKGDRAGENFVAITDAGTKMETQARGDRFREVRINPSDIGGRYSALSYFGLLPAALMGVKLKEYLDRADQAVNACRPSAPLDQNPGFQLGSALAGLAGAGRDKLTLITPEPLGALGLWVEQLIAESTGKEDRGILPVAGETLGPPEVYGQDRVFVRVRVNSSTDPNTDARLQALEAAGHPVIEHVLDGSLDLGAEFFNWEVATALAGKALGINPFDQPNVQESKDYTKDLLAEYQEKGAFSEPGTLAGFQGLTFSTDPANAQALDAALREPDGRSRAVALLREHFRRVQPGDYVAFTHYIAERPERDATILKTRLAVRDALKVATTTGYGPRFLHSTGQLHKGGPPTGVFVQVTADDGQGQPIPGEPYDFATMVKAQALGDFLSLSKRGRRALRVHLGTDVDRALRILDELVRDALGGP
jgi:transaldolase/glucose-6-phosphate isomerase